MISRGGRGDRIGRYGNTHNDHNFRDMDYRAYGQEDEEAETGCDARGEEDGLYPSDEPSLNVHGFSLSFNHDRPGFQHRRGGRGDIGREGKGLLWPPSSQLHPDMSHPILQREEEGSGREFKPLQTGLQEMGRGKSGRGFPENSGPHSGSREGSWHHLGAHSEQMEFGPGRPREDDKFSRGAGQRKVTHFRSSVCI